MDADDPGAVRAGSPGAVSHVCVAVGVAESLADALRIVNAFGLSDPDYLNPVRANTKS
ncbi:hypothetical protein [Microbacterium sp. NPDC077184]|uniref:hypothetical protein n=1 Tax=Microbacterium sp. NPDC077184 TaxID=3154764 RepID=UPI0034484952